MSTEHIKQTQYTNDHKTSVHRSGHYLAHTVGKTEHITCTLGMCRKETKGPFFSPMMVT